MAINDTRLGPYCFVFDAEFLVEKGLVLIVDNTFYNVFMDSIEQWPESEFEPDGLIDRVKSLALKVHQETERSDALSLEKSDYYFCPGILPVEWALDYGLVSKVKSETGMSVPR